MLHFNLYDIHFPCREEDWGVRFNETAFLVTTPNAQTLSLLDPENPIAHRFRFCLLSFVFSAWRRSTALCLLLPFVILLSTSLSFATDPTLARLSFWVSPERMAVFGATYKEKAVPILKQHSLLASAQRGRTTPDPDLSITQGVPFIRIEKDTSGWVLEGAV